MLVIQCDTQLCSKRLISNVEHLIINPPLQSVFNLAFCHQLSQSMIARLHTLDVLAGIEETRTCSHPFRHPRGSLRKFIRRLRLNMRQLLQT